MRFCSILAFALVTAAPAIGASADVKYRGTVDLAHFACRENPHPSFVKRTCYDAQRRYMLILLDRTWYHYCDMDAGTYAAFTGDSHMGTFFARRIKGTGEDGPFDCRTHPHIPQY